MFVITLSEVIVLVAIITLVGLGGIIAFLYRIAESFENRKNKRLEKMWKENEDEIH